MVLVHRAVVQLDTCYTIQHLQRVLPPEHRVVATTRSAQPFRLDCLVEGPSLPLCPSDRRPGEAKLVLTMTDSDGLYTLDGAWAHKPAERWQIGQWTDLYAYFDEILPAAGRMDDDDDVKAMLDEVDGMLQALSQFVAKSPLT